VKKKLAVTAAGLSSSGDPLGLIDALVYATAPSAPTWG
jgi:hypothetical protein